MVRRRVALLAEVLLLFGPHDSNHTRADISTELRDGKRIS